MNTMASVGIWRMARDLRQTDYSSISTAEQAIRALLNLAKDDANWQR